MSDRNSLSEFFGIAQQGEFPRRCAAEHAAHNHRMGTSSRGFKGNKQSLPSKPCVACGRPMTWRKRWERTWDEVKYCSDACRRRGAPSDTANPANR